MMTGEQSECTREKRESPGFEPQQGQRRERKLNAQHLYFVRTHESPALGDFGRRKTLLTPL